MSEVVLIALIGVLVIFYLIFALLGIGDEDGADD